MAETKCGDFGLWCKGGELMTDTATDAVQQAGGDVLTLMVEKTFTALGDFLQQTAFAWIDAPTPGLSTGGVPEESSSLPKSVVTLLEQVEWVGYAAAIGALLIVACRISRAAHSCGPYSGLTDTSTMVLVS